MADPTERDELDKLFETENSYRVSLEIAARRPDLRQVRAMLELMAEEGMDYRAEYRRLVEERPSRLPPLPPLEQVAPQLEGRAN